MAIDPRKFLTFDETHKDAGIITVVPTNEGVQNTYSPQGQMRCLVDWIVRHRSDYGIRTVLWDGISTQAAQLVNEYAVCKVNKDESSKHFTILADPAGGNAPDNILSNTPGINWRDNGMAQKELRHQMRDKLMALHDLNWIITGHTVAQPDKGVFGLDAGGPAGAKPFTQPMSSSLYIFKGKDGSRWLATEGYKHHTLGLDVQAKWKVAPGTKIEGALDQPGRHIAVPEDTFEGSVGVWRVLLAANAAINSHVVLMGDEDAGKTALASAFLGLPDTKPALVVMAEAQNSLAAFWPEVLRASTGSQNKAAKKED